MIKQPTLAAVSNTRGAALMIFMVLFVFSATALTFLLARNIYSDLSMLSSLGTSKQSFLVSESLAEEMTLRLMFGTYAIDSVESLAFAGATAHGTTTFDSVTEEMMIDTRGERQGAVRKSQIILTLGVGNSFNYGLQAGTGGISLANSAGIVGNVYSNGPVEGQGSSIIRGDVVSAGPSGYILDIHATGSAYAHTIEDSLIEGDLYVASIGDDISNSVNGTRNYGSPDLPITDFPIDDATVQEWKDVIVNTGTVIAATDPECSSGTYTIDDPATIGYLKIECDVNIRDQGSPATVVTLTGPIWVEGNLAFTQGPDIRVAPAVGRRSVQIIVDDESDRLTSGQIEVRNSTNFFGSGDSRSYIMLLSMNESSSLGGSEIAIDVAQSANGEVLVYAGNGLIEVGNGIELKEITAHQINVAQNTDIIYESGLQNLLFTAGPGGSYNIADWQEVF